MRIPPMITRPPPAARRWELRPAWARRSGWPPRAPGSRTQDVRVFPRTLTPWYQRRYDRPRPRNPAYATAAQAERGDRCLQPSRSGSPTRSRSAARPTGSRPLPTDPYFRIRSRAPTVYTDQTAAAPTSSRSPRSVSVPNRNPSSPLPTTSPIPTVPAIPAHAAARIRSWPSHALRSAVKMGSWSAARWRSRRGTGSCP
jgi:hypothetical protein